MGQDAPRNDVNPDDGLLDFGSEAPNTALDKKESDVAFNRSEPDAPLDGSEPVVISDSREPDVAFGSKEPDSAFGRKDLEIVFNRQEQDITSGTRKLDIQPDAHELPLHAPSVQSFMRYRPAPVVHRSSRLNIGIALLMLGSIGALAWSGRLLGMRRDAGTSGAQIQNASQPTYRPGLTLNHLPRTFPRGLRHRPSRPLRLRRHPRLPARTHPMHHELSGLYARQNGCRSTQIQTPQAVCLRSRVLWERRYSWITS